MKTYRTLIVLLAIGWVLFASCSNGSSAVLPGTNPDQSVQTQTGAGTQTQLWGLYNVYIDVPTKTATAVPNRSAMFAANVVSFLNSKPTSLSFLLMHITDGTSYLDVDIDITLTHPFSGKTQYNGFDVRGVMMGDGSVKLAYNPKLNAPGMGTDQFMMDDPVNHDGGGPDGYTRWFNATEFTSPGVFGYTNGIYTPGSPNKPPNPNATLCPYKYFADGLGAEESLLPYLESNMNNGVFTAGTSATRNYYIRFKPPSPNTPLTFAYAVVADWKGVNPADQPANAPEAVAAFIDTSKSNLFFNSPTDFGGALVADITVYDWNSTLVGGVMHAYTINIDTGILPAIQKATEAQMTAIDWGDHWAVYHFELPAIQLPAVQDNEGWAIIEYPGQTYKNDFGVTNGAGNDPLAAFFRFDVPVSPGQASMSPPVLNVSMTSSFTFDPFTIVAPVGATVRWTNNGTTMHSATSDPLNPVSGGPDSDTQYPAGMSPSDTYDWVVPNVAPGTQFYYHCKFHGTAGPGTDFGTGMVGVVRVSTTLDVSMSPGHIFVPVGPSAHPGDMIVWTNDDVDNHTVTSDPLNAVAGGPDSDTVYPNGLQTNNKFYWIVPSAPAGTTWYYHCRFHGGAGNGSSVGTGMAGWIAAL
jgi:plastocyanin